MSLIYLFLWWLIATSLGMAAIVALEPLWRDRGVEPSHSDSRLPLEPVRARIEGPRSKR